MNKAQEFGTPTGLTVDDAARLRIEAHQTRVAALSKVLAIEMGLGKSRAALVADAAALHDIGKLFIPSGYIQKPTSLNDIEWEVVRQHPVWGHAILSPCQHPTLRMAATVALQHHENWDGTGYPYGLAGEEISLETRIVSICDVYDALRDDRPYRTGIGHNEALAVIEQGDGRTAPIMFDPVVLDAFLMCHPSLSEVFAKNEMSKIPVV